MRVEDVADPVVVAAGKTPFESNRRVFVLERVEEMNDEVANRMLKTLEEPPPYAHLVLLTDAPGRVLETVRLALPTRPLRPAAGGTDRGRARPRRASSLHARGRAPGLRSATSPARVFFRRQTVAPSARPRGSWCARR